MYLAPPQGVTPSEFREDVDLCKIGMIGLTYGEKNYDDMLSRFHTIPACYVRTDRRTDRQTDGRTDRIAISISRVSSSMLTRDKN